MHHNPNNDPRYRQQQLEMCREQLNRNDGRNQRQRGIQDFRRERGPIFNEYGQAVNMPPSVYQMPRNVENMYHPSPGHFPGNYCAPPPWNNQQYQTESNTFSLCYTLSEDRNSPARRILDALQGHPMIPKNMTPKQVIFVYEKPETLVIPQHFIIHTTPSPNFQPKPQTVDAAVGDFSVVRYDVETQTEWVEADKERNDVASSPADNTTIPSKPIISGGGGDSKVETLDDEYSDGRAEFLSNIVKVAKWLQTSPDHQNLKIIEEDDAEVFGGVAPLQRNMDTDKNDKMDVRPTTIERHSHEAEKMKSGGDGSENDEKTGLVRRGKEIQTVDGEPAAAVGEEPNTAASCPGNRGDHEDTTPAAQVNLEKSSESQ